MSKNVPKELTQADIDEWQAAHDRYMAIAYPAFGRRLWTHWKRLFLTVLVNGFIILVPFAFVFFMAWARQRPAVEPLPPARPLDPATVAELDAAVAALHAKEAKGFRDTTPSPRVPPLDPAIVAENEALLAAAKGKKTHPH